MVDARSRQGRLTVPTPSAGVPGGLSLNRSQPDGGAPANRPRADVFDVATAIYAASIPFESITFAGRGIGFVSAGLLLLASVVRICGLARPGRLAIDFNVLLPLVAFPGLTLTSYWWSVDPSATVTRSITLLLLVTVSSLIVALGTATTVRFLLAGYIGGCVVVAAEVVRNYRGLALASGPTEFRSTAAAANANDLASVIAIGAALAAGLAITTQRRKWALALLAVFAWLGLAASLSASRTAAVTVLLTTVAAILLGRRGHRLQQVLLVAVSLSAFYVFLERVDGRVIGRLLGTADLIQQGDLSSRQLFWRAGLEAFGDRPVAGWGGGSFPSVLADYLGIRDAAHNSLISVATELGIAGLVTFTWLILRTVKGAMRCSHYRVPLVLAVGALSVSALLASWDYRKAPWLIAALVLLAERTTRRDPVRRGSDMRLTRAGALVPYGGGGDVPLPTRHLLGRSRRNKAWNDPTGRP